MYMGQNVLLDYRPGYTPYFRDVKAPHFCVARFLATLFLRFSKKIRPNFVPIRNFGNATHNRVAGFWDNAMRAHAHREQCFVAFYIRALVSVLYV